MNIVDAQVHLWRADSPERPWPRYGHEFAHGREMLADAMLAKMDEAGVDRAILVPPSWEGDRNEVCLEAARQYPHRFAVMGRLSLERPMRKEALEAWMRQPGMLGVRLTFRQDFQRAWLADGTADWFWSAAEELQIPVMVLAHGVLPQIRTIAEKHRNLKLAIDHLALAGVCDEAIFAHLAPVLSLARFPNINVKATGLPSLTTESYPFPTLQEVIHRVVDTFGPRRTFWGSDATKLRCPLRECAALFTEACHFLNEEDKNWIMGRSVTEWLDWNMFARHSKNPSTGMGARRVL